MAVRIRDRGGPYLHGKKGPEIKQQGSVSRFSPLPLPVHSYEMVLPAFQIGLLPIFNSFQKQPHRHICEVRLTPFLDTE